MVTGVSAWTRHCGLLAPVIVALAGCSGDDEAARKIGRNAYVDVSGGQLSSCGVVVIGTIDAQQSATTGAGDAVVHSTTWVRDDRYEDMEDNDLRGFLDGTFKEGWNQVSQAHLRLGRRARNPVYGEYELFRNLQRWDGLTLPANAEILNAEMTLSIESGPPYAVDIAIYAVRKDWNPGSGGVNKDNNSPPAPGEVWWLDARFGDERWASAGVGYASDSDSRADTYAQPLALAHYEPGDTRLDFASPELARYAQERVRRSEPLLLLLKLTDVFEDSVGSVFEIWSANVGVAGSERRPRLTLAWRAPPGAATVELPVMLEAGRSIVIPDIDAEAGEILAGSFHASEELATRACGQDAYLEFRETSGAWQPLDRPVTLESKQFDLRVTAATRPVPLGDTIALRLRDTWIPVGEPQDHIVNWTIRRPDGLAQDVAAAFDGDYSWHTEVTADIPGRWSFRWQHELSGAPSQGEWHVIDVVARELEQVSKSLIRLQGAIEASGAAPRSHAMLPFELRFMRLERALAAQLAANGASDAEKQEISSIIKQLRETLSGRELPDNFVPEPIGSREAPAGK